MSGRIARLVTGTNLTGITTQNLFGETLAGFSHRNRLRLNAAKMIDKG